jgi:putative endonuclease
VLAVREERIYFTYIVASCSRTLYIGVTGDLPKRVFQHKDKTFEGFSAQYNCDRLVWFERFGDPRNAIAREKQLKGWRREKEIALIEKSNPTWADLSEGWYVIDPSRMRRALNAAAGPSTRPLARTRSG